MIYESDLAIGTTNITDEAPVVMGSNDYEMIELFKKLNVSRPIALTLTCLVKRKELPLRKSKC